jgi:UDP-glucuronate 4-epimerase
VTKQILITGIAGFIGFHLARALQARGDRVVGIDNFNDYYDVALKKARGDILQKEKIEVIQADICEVPFLEKLVRDYEISHFVHLAAQAGVRHSIKHPEAYVKTNLDGFVRVMEVCRHAPKGMKFIYASSSSVYGLNTKVPFSETDSTDQPASLYGATKKSNELVAHAYHHLYGIPVTGLRFFTVYGPWGRPDMAYFSFTHNILKNIPIQVFNAGQMERDFTYIDDIVQGIVAAIDLGASCEIFNLGGNCPVDVLKLIDLIEKHTGKKAERQLMPMQQGDLPTTYADISKSQKLLGFNPKVPFEEGIRRFVTWFQEYAISSKA